MNALAELVDEDLVDVNAVDWRNIQPHPDLQRIAQMCICGRDAGDHQADAPHACDETDCGAFVPQ